MSNKNVSSPLSPAFISLPLPLSLTPSVPPLSIPALSLPSHSLSHPHSSPSLHPHSLPSPTLTPLSPISHTYSLLFSFPPTLPPSLPHSLPSPTLTPLSPVSHTYSLLLSLSHPPSLPSLPPLSLHHSILSGTTHCVQ